MIRVRGQANVEMQAAIMLAGLLSVAAVAGGYWWYQQGHLNLPRDIARQFDDARAMAQAGVLNVQVSSSNNQTTVLIDTGSDPNAGRIIRTNTFQGTATFVAGTQTGTTVKFIVSPNGTAQIVGSGNCPSGLSLQMSASQSYPISCDPLSVIGV